jgi:hypothetical protein
MPGRRHRRPGAYQKPEKVLRVELILHKKMPLERRKLLKFFAGLFLEAAKAGMSRFEPG